MSNDDDDNDDKGQGVISPMVSIALRKRGTAGGSWTSLCAEQTVFFVPLQDVLLWCPGISALRIIITDDCCLLLLRHDTTQLLFGGWLAAVNDDCVDDDHSVLIVGHEITSFS